MPNDIQIRTDQSQDSLIVQNNKGIKEVVDTFIDQLDRMQTTKDKYRSCLYAFFAWCKNTGRKVPELTRKDIIDYKEHFNPGLDRSILTVKLYLSAIRQFYIWAEAEKFYPNGLPVSGKVTIEDEPVENSEVSSEMMNDKELRKMVIFGAANDAKVMAAGSGKVTSIKRDTEFGYAVRIDHGNGYITIYRYNDQPKIKEGDDVTKGQLLFEVGFASSKVGYQIMYDNEYINPMDIMEING